MLPKSLDEKVARLHLGKLGVKLTELKEQPGRLYRRRQAGTLQARLLSVLTGWDSDAVRFPVYLLDRR